MRWRPGTTTPRTDRRNHLASVVRLCDLAESPWPDDRAPDVLSLDVFDTVLTRTCGAPADLHLWLGRWLHARGHLTTTPEVFARVRHQAELAVWRREGGLDSHVSLEDFHVEVCRRLGLDESEVPMLVAAEIALEEASLRIVPGAGELVKRAVEDGVEVVFASDTYHSADFIRDRLTAFGLLTSGGRCLVSSAIGTSKVSGGLFEELMGRMNGAPDVLHVGDHPHSDVDMPRHVGCRARWASDARLTRYEQLLSEAAFETAGLSASFAGASRLARLAAPGGTATERAIREVAGGVAAPLLVGYVLWLLRRAHASGVERLVFLARDGQIMALIARELVRRLQSPLDVQYLHVSRRSTNLAATFELSSEETGWVDRDVADLAPLEFLSRYGLTSDDLPVEVRALASGPSARRLADALRTPLLDGPLRAVVLRRAAERRAELVAYLDQEGLLDGRRNALVDFGGVGSQVRALHTLLVSAGAPSPRVYLVGLDDPTDAGLTRPEGTPDWLADTDTYLYDHRRGRGVRRSRGFGTCVQMFCAADHGTVIGYRSVGGRIEPEFATSEDSELLDWGLGTMRAAIMSFVDHLTLDAELLDVGADVRRVTCELVDRFWSDPTDAEAAAWGAFPFEGALATDDARRPLAHPYTPVYIRDAIRAGRFPDLGWRHWYEGSLRLTAPALRAVVTQAERAYWALERADGPGSSRVASLVRRVSGR